MMKKLVNTPEQEWRREWNQNFQDSGGLWEEHRVEDVASQWVGPQQEAGP